MDYSNSSSFWVKGRFSMRVKNVQKNNKKAP